MEKVKTRRKSSPYAKKTIRLLGIALGLIAASLLAYALARGNPEWVTRRFIPWGQKVSAFLGTVFSIFPFSFAEAALCLGILAVLVTLARLPFCVRRKGAKTLGRYVTVLLLIAAALFSLFTGAYGLGYYGLPLETRLGLPAGRYTTDELYETTAEYLELANTLALLVERDEDGVFSAGDRRALYRRAALIYENDSSFIPLPEAPVSAPKGVTLWIALSYMGIAGIYSPFTGECNVNGDTSEASLPYTACHELAHRAGYYAEDEANFVSLVLCRESDDLAFRYSAAYAAFVYGYNALYRADPFRAYDLIADAVPELVADLAAAVKRSQKYEGVVAEVSEKINDSYLKSVGQESGVESYGQVVDLLIAERLNRAGSP
jgi:hypothetical protein